MSEAMEHVADHRQGGLRVELKQWHFEIFGDAKMTTALLDRLIPNPDDPDL
jgi:hypothetical protein